MAISQQKTWVTAETITAAGLNADPAALVDAVNDQAGQYTTLLTASAPVFEDTAAATYFVCTSSGANPIANNADFTANGLNNLPFFYFDDNDATATSLTQKLRIRAQVCTNATAWSSVTATFGLYPVTFAGAADVLTVSLGTVVVGSTVAIANPSASLPNQGNSGDFTIPSDGQYALGVVLSAQLTNNAAALLCCQLQSRSV